MHPLVASWRRLATVVIVAVAAQTARAQDPKEATEILERVLGTLLGLTEMTGPELQKEVAEAGGVPFLRDVPLDFLNKEALVRYLDEVLDTEYPEARARADQRTLEAFDLLETGTDLRGVRAKLLRENVAGFYDERPGRKRLYAVSADRRLTPTNQLVLAHELRHAIQDQYIDVHGFLPASVGDFDDRRVAFLCLLEGDATWVMERFLVRRLPLVSSDAGLEGALPVPDVAGAPRVLRDQLVLPYLVGRGFVRSLWAQGGAAAVRKAWAHPPDSTEQVLHPEKYLAREAVRRVRIDYAPPGGRPLSDGVLGEIFVRSLLEADGDSAASSGWGGDLYKAWDLSGKTLLIWRSLWDTATDAREFFDALLARLLRTHGAGQAQGGLLLFSKGGWTVAVGASADGVLFISSDNRRAVEDAARGLK